MQVHRNLIVDRLAGKVSKADVNYRPAEGEQKASCSECVHYLYPGQPTSECRRVAGVVDGSEVCDVFAPRQDETDQGQNGTV